MCAIKWKQIDNLCLVNITVRHSGAWIQGQNFRTNNLLKGCDFFPCRQKLLFTTNSQVLKQREETVCVYTSLVKTVSGQQQFTGSDFFFLNLIYATVSRIPFFYDYFPLASKTRQSFSSWLCIAKSLFPLTEGLADVGHGLEDAVRKVDLDLHVLHVGQLQAQ